MSKKSKENLGFQYIEVSRSFGTSLKNGVDVAVLKKNVHVRSFIHSINEKEFSHLLIHCYRNGGTWLKFCKDPC